MNTMEIKNERQSRDEQNVIAALADGLPHVFTSGEHLIKAVRRLARAGRVSMTALRAGEWMVKFRGEV